MSTVHLKFCTFFIGLATIYASTADAQQVFLKPFKDDLFAQQTVIESADGGAYKKVDYQELRDINGRDREPERRVKDAYVSLGVRRYQQNETLDTGPRGLDVARVGQEAGASFTVIFIHGRGGDRRLGVNDFTFGGNFNRLKNLIVGSGGSYYAPTVRSFDVSGVADITALIHYASERSAGRPVILACASMGSIICQGISREQSAVRELKGLIILGGAADAELPNTVLAKSKLPIYFAHGSADSVYDAERQAAVYRKLKANGYPTRFTLFETGSHGTPIRMVDWREALNFILAGRS